VSMYIIIAIERIHSSNECRMCAVYEIYDGCKLWSLQGPASLLLAVVEPSHSQDVYLAQMVPLSYEWPSLPLVVTLVADNERFLSIL